MHLKIEVSAMNADASWRSSVNAQKAIEMDLPDDLTEIPDLSAIVALLTRTVNIEYNTKLAEEAKTGE